MTIPTTPVVTGIGAYFGDFAIVARDSAILDDVAQRLTGEATVPGLNREVVVAPMDVADDGPAGDDRQGVLPLEDFGGAVAIAAPARVVDTANSDLF